MIEQTDLFALFPGAPGGRALRDERGIGYLISIATIGGRTTHRRYGSEYMRTIGERGRAERRRKRHTQPRTIVIFCGPFVEYIREIPYWPPRPARRKRPVIVRLWQIGAL